MRLGRRVHRALRHGLTCQGNTGPAKVSVVQGIPPVLVAAMGRHLGKLVWADRIVQGSQGMLWRAQVGRCEVAIKIHHSRAAHERELWAYRRLAEALRARMPRLLMAAHGAIVVDWIAGENVGSLGDASRRWSAFRQAGELRRQMNELSASADPLSMSDALSLRVDGWLRRARDRLDARLVASVERDILRLDDSRASRRPCHRDNTPENWILDRDDRLWLVDWGQARDDCWLCDVAKVSQADFRDDPQARRAFWLGFGRELDEEETRWLRAFEQLHGLQSTVWGLEHGNEELRKLGVEILERCWAGA